MLADKVRELIETKTGKTRTLFWTGYEFDSYGTPQKPPGAHLREFESKAR